MRAWTCKALEEWHALYSSPGDGKSQVITSEMSIREDNHICYVGLPQILGEWQCRFGHRRYILFPQISDSETMGCGRCGIPFRTLTVSPFVIGNLIFCSSSMSLVLSGLRYGPELGRKGGSAAFWVRLLLCPGGGQCQPTRMRSQSSSRSTPSSTSLPTPT